MTKTRYNYYNPLNMAFSMWKSRYNKRKSSASKLKDPESYTLTKTKTEEENNMEDNPQGFKTTSIYINTGNPYLRDIVKSKISYRDTFTQVNVWNTGTEHLSVGPYVGTKSQYLDATNNTARTDRTGYSYVPFFDLNPLQGVAAASVVDAIPAPQADWIGITTGSLHFDFVNKSTLPCVVKIHFYVAKDSTDTNVLENYRDGQLSNHLYNTTYSFGTNSVPTISGNESVSYNTGSTSTPPYMNVLPYTNLMKNRLVKSNWKKLKTTTFILSSADTQRINVFMILNQFAIKERIDNESDPYPKGCLHSVIEYQGVAGKLVASDNITYGGGNVGYCCTRKLNLCVRRAPNSRFETAYVGQGTITQGGLLSTTEQYTEVITEQIGTSLT